MKPSHKDMAMKTILAALLIVLMPILAWAQNTATPVQPGYISTSGCHSPALTPCFIPYNAANPMPITGTATTPWITTGASSTITVGGTFQTISAANASRHSFEFTNICGNAGACNATTDNCYLFFASFGDANPNITTTAFKIPPGGSYLRSSGSIPSDAIQATCDGTGDHFRMAVQ